MKKILLSLSLLTLTLQASAQTQIGNSNFEQWENLGQDEVEPVNWNSFMNAVTNFITSAAKAKQVDRSTDIRPGTSGSYSAKIWSRDVGGIAIANGNLTVGRIYAESISPTNAANHNRTITTDAAYSETFNDTPDSIVMWLKYVPINTSSQARISCMIHTNVNFKDPNDTLSTTTLKAKATSAIPYANGAWQRVAVKFSDVNAALTASHIIVTFTTNKTPGGGSANDQLFIDDLELIYVPKASFTASGTTICQGGSLNFTSTSTNYPATYSWNFGDGSPAVTTANASHTFATAGTYNVTLTATNQWGSTTSTSVAVTVSTPLDATFNYSQATYCSNAGNQTPTAVNPGAFSATPAGLSINATTGVINLAASTAGTYTVTNTTSGACPDTKTTSITINAAANASFAYPTNTICTSDGNQTPTAAEAGTFSSTPTGLVFANTTTGEINVSGSTPGTYTVTHNVAGTCPNSSQVNVTLTANPDATFTYNQTAYCSDTTDPSPVFGNGASGGVFTSTAGLSINSNSGLIDLSASTAGTYSVINTIAAVGTCPADADTFVVVVNALPNVALGTFTDVCVYNPAFALTGGTPTGGSYSGSGVSAGSFNPNTAGLGIKTITYSYTDAVTTCSNTATNTINVEACLGLNDNETATVSVYPNPTDGKLALSNLSKEISFRVVSVSGQVVLNGVVSNTANTIDLSPVENGIYVLQLTQEQGLQSIRIVKK